MSEVAVVEAPKIADLRSAFVLREGRLGHCPEFRDFFARTFDLERVGLTREGYLQAPSGMVYAVVFIGRSGEPFPPDRWRQSAEDKGGPGSDRPTLSRARRRVTQG